MGPSLARRADVVALGLLLAGVFLLQSTRDFDARWDFDLRWGVVPAEVRPATLVTYAFLHADAAHLGSNLLFLWFFGNLLRDVVGRVAFAVTFLVAAVVGGVLHARVEAGSYAPMIGASGALSGLAGAYFMLAQRWELPSAYVWPMARPVDRGAVALAALANFAIDASSLFGRARDHVAYGAHAGGFLGGAACALLLTSFTSSPASTPPRRR